MNKTLKAADEVRKLHRMFAALGDVVSVLDVIGTLEQAEGEARARIDALNARAEKIGSDVAAAEVKADDIAKQSEKLLQDANFKVADLIQGANAEYEAIIAKAKLQAADIEYAAKLQQDRFDAEAQAHAEAVKSRAEALAELERKIEQARAQIAKMLGG